MEELIGTVNIYVIKISFGGSGWAAQLAGASSHTPKRCGLISGHVPRLQV